ncbi:GMC family oxidoreductase [Myxococcota bacterium]|nr:GMC family oxidoreductase [Myxococcota bacterium]
MSTPPPPPVDDPLAREGAPLPLSEIIHPEVPADGWEAARGGRQLQADVVIVGTGPGGASAARALAMAGARVVLLEEGPAAARFRPNQAHTARHHMQEGGSMVAQGNGLLPIAAGRGVGGGTLINSALSFRAPDEILDGWATLLQDDGWSGAAMAPLYDEISSLIGVRLMWDEIAGRNNQLIVQGSRALGLPGGLAPRSTPGCMGCGLCNFGCPVQGKASMNLSLLPRAWQHGARIQADTRVDEVLVEGGRAVGVRGRCLHPDTGELVGEVVVRAPKVVLSAGAIGTPRLLWHQGLARDLGPVGEGLHVHPGNAVLSLHDETVSMWKGATQGAYFTHPDLPGVLPHAFTAPPEVCLGAIGAVGRELGRGIELLPRLGGCVVMVSDKGEGRVRATSEGRAALTYHFDEGDLERTKRGMVETARVLFAAGARRVIGIVHGVGWHDSVESFERALADRRIDHFTLYAAHPMSTTRMGRDPQTSVVGPDGQAHRLPGLYISDAGAFPTSLGVNPQLTTMALGTRLGQRIARAG